jgi:hypothetical protein
MGILLIECNLLWGLVTDTDLQTVGRGGDQQIPIAEATGEIEGLAGGLLEREAHRVGLDALLHGLTHLGRRAEEPVGGDETVERLVGTLEVVRVNEEGQSSLAIREVCEHGA